MHPIEQANPPAHHQQLHQATKGVQHMPKYFRLCSISRLPGLEGKGVQNEATLYHPTTSLTVRWASSAVDIRLNRGGLVMVHGCGGRTTVPDRVAVTKIEHIDRPVVSINPFEFVPGAWLPNTEFLRRAATLWERLDRPFQHLFNAVLWDGQRFYRYITGPASLIDDVVPPGANFAYAVELAEQALSLAEGLPHINRNVLIVAALLGDAGKAEGFKRTPEGGLNLTERGRWIGYQQTVLEWLAVAREKVIVADSSYHRLVHVLMARANPSVMPIADEIAFLRSAASFVESPVRFHGFPSDLSAIPTSTC